MAILDDVLKEEYDRLNRMESAYQKELSALGDAAKGSVRLKTNQRKILSLPPVS
jgi:hypothetical protein